MFNCAVSGQDRHAFKVQRLIVNETFEPIWVRSPDASCWIYSLKVPQRVTVQCQEIGSPSIYKLSYQMLLEGTRILPNFSCYTLKTLSCFHTP